MLSLSDIISKFWIIAIPVIPDTHLIQSLYVCLQSISTHNFICQGPMNGLLVTVIKPEAKYGIHITVVILLYIKKILKGLGDLGIDVRIILKWFLKK